MLFSSGNGGWGVVDDYALSCVYGHLRGGQRDEVGDLNAPYAFVMDTEPLLPHPVYLLGVEHFDLLDEFVHHPGHQLAGAGVASKDYLAVCTRRVAYGCAQCCLQTQESFAAESSPCRLLREKVQRKTQ